MKDAHDRIIDYLRVSVTDRCNERCFYCMPLGYHGWSCAQDRMSADQILAVVRDAAQMGFRKIRLTGGEPLVRKDLVEIATRIWEIPGIEALGLSTNGTLLAPLAKRLKRAGIRSINVSLDALDPIVYQAITGGKLQNVLEGLEAARNEGFEMIKLNCVLLCGINEGQLRPLADYAAVHSHPMRYIELMPMAGKFDFASHYLPVESARRLLDPEGTRLIADPDARLGHGPARYWRDPANGGRIGFIGAMTAPHFCASCNKVRLTSDGKLRPCLGREGEIDLKSMSTPAEALAAAISNKPLDHTFANCEHQEGRPMTAIGG
jgi:cyclic pyranopterin phosphate synthase